MIRTKVQIPPIPPNLIARPHLVERLTAVQDPKLILVSAPAGFGKSTSINVWVQKLEQSVAWLSLDAGDNDPVRFWTYLLAALQSAGVGLETGLSQMASAGTEAIATALINELADLSEPVVLVLDDYHLITESSIHDALGLLLEHMSEGVTLIIITRADPPFPLGRLRARGWLIELRIADLRFSSDEVTVFLQDAMKLSLNANEISALETRTEGWVAGLQLVGLAVRRHANPAAFVEAFAGSHHYIVEYLTEEVIHQQPEEVQRFLLETANLDRLCAPLCDAVTGRGNSAHMLHRLREENLFLIALDPAHTWYRYHHLFAELLRHRQGQMLDAGTIRELYRRASDWHEKAGQVPEAVEYALTGSIHAQAAHLLEENWHHIQHRGELSTMRRWLAALPAEVVRGNPVLHMAACWLYHLSGQADLIKPELALVRESWQVLKSKNAIPASQTWTIVPSLIESISAIVALNRNDPQATIAHAQKAIDLIPTDLEPEYNALLIGAASYRLALAHDVLGQVEEAIRVMRAVLEHLKHGGNIIGLVRGIDEIVRMYLSIDRTSEAQKLCDDMLAYLTQQGYGRLPLTGLIYVAMTEISVHKKDFEEARSRLDRALPLAGKSSYPGLPARVEALQTQLASAPSTNETLVEPLTARELEVLGLLGAGHSNQQIADALIITEDTVKRHNSHIYGKLGVTNRTQAVLRAQELNLL